MSEWQDCTLGEYAKVLGGYAFKSNDFGDTGDFPVIKIKNVAGGTLDMTVCQYISRAVAETATRFRASRGDILIAMTGSHVHQPSSMVGKVTRYSTDDIAYINQRVGKVFSKDIKKLNGDFLFYFLKWDETTYGLALSAGGSANQANISAGQIEGLQISVPGVEEQRVVSEVLLSLDAKIDLMVRQNATLETLAQTYFRQWFIEEANEDWEGKELRYFGNIICGKTPSTKKPEYFGDDVPFLKIPDMHNNTFIFVTADYLSTKGAKSQSNKTVPAKSICVSCIATVGLVSINAIECQTNQQINSLVPNDSRYLYYLYLFLKNYTNSLIALGSGGTTVGNINTTLFGDIKCALPPQKLIEEFSNLTRILFDKIEANTRQILTLQKLRDTLLPKLISGEVRVKEA